MTKTGRTVVGQDGALVVSPETRRAALLAGSVGNFIELFDFTLYGYFATTLAAVFFPGSGHGTALLETFGVFAVGFLVRPLGGAVFGHLGDRVGRRPVLAATIILMGAGTVLIGVLPTYRVAGVAAPWLLLGCRLIQSFAHGGEYVGANTFIVEYAPPGRRGRYAAAMPVAVACGTVAAALVALLITVSVNPGQLSTWGWRLAFVLAGPLGAFGLYLRLKVEESPAFAAVRRAHTIESVPLLTAVRTSGGAMLVLFGWTIVNALGFYLLSGYMVSYLTETAGASKRVALASSLIAMVIFGAMALLAGNLADKYGRLRLAAAAGLLLGVLVLPSFMLLQRGTLATATVGQSICAACLAFISTLTSIFVVEFFRARVRYSASAVVYNLSYLIFGGTGPYVATWLVTQTGDKQAPGFYLLAAAAVSTFTIALFGRRVYSAAPEIQPSQPPASIRSASSS